MLGSPTHPLQTTMNATRAANWSGFGAFRPYTSWRAIKKRAVKATAPSTRRRVRGRRGMTLSRKSSRASPEAKKITIVK